MWAAIGRAGSLSEMLNIESMIQGSKVETRSHKFSASALMQQKDLNKQTL